MDANAVRAARLRGAGRRRLRRRRGGGGGGTSTPAAEAVSTDGAKVAPTLDAGARRRRATSRSAPARTRPAATTRAVERFNERYADQGLGAELLEFPEGSDNQREQAVQRLEARSPECDVIQADIIWIAEFASQKWAMDMTEYIEGREDEFIPSTLAPNAVRRSLLGGARR